MPPKLSNKKAPNKKGANGYKLPEPIPAGEILTDIAKKKWVIGPSIGVGGFGEIYSASLHKDGNKKMSYDYVVKIEPHGNGPLFVEMHFYMRNAKSTDIDAWIKQKGLSYLGMPRYIGSGSHECNGQKYRFVVMQRFGKDLWSLFLESERAFPIPTVFRIGYQVLNVLEYIHNRGYVHADIKGANILMGIDAKLQLQTYLVDFGLASHFTTKDFKSDPKKAHNGTIEYTSRDAHHGVPTRRGDIEILAYNLLQWLGNVLPWEKKLTDPVLVQKQKEEFMSSISGLTTTFKKVPVELKKLFEYVISMKYDTEPDYDKLRDILQKGIKNNVESNDDELLFMTPVVPKIDKPKTVSPKADKRKNTTPKRETALVKKKSRTVKSRKVEEDLNESTESEIKSPNSRQLSPVVKMNKITFDLADLSGSDDNYEPSPSVKRKVDRSPKQSRNHLQRVQSNEKNVKQPPNRLKRIKSEEKVDETNENNLIQTRNHLKRVQSEEKLEKTNANPSPKIRKKIEAKPKKDIQLSKQLSKIKLNLSDTENKASSLNNTTEDFERSDSDIFLSFTEENVSSENTTNRRRSSSRFHPKNIESSDTKSSGDDLQEKKTSKRKVLTSTVDDNHEVVKKTRSTVKKPAAASWKNFPTIQNGKTASK